MRLVKRLSFLCVAGIALFCSCNLRPFDSDRADQQYEFAAAALDIYFIYRDMLPPDLYAFDTPQELYESVNEPYTTFYTRDEARILASYLTTKTGGIGIRIDSVANGYLIKQVFAGSPGEEAGLLAGDIIIMVDQEAVAGISPSELVGILQGELGSEVLIRVKRGGVNRNITVERGVYTSPSVFVDSVSETVASIILSGFYGETAVPGGSAEEFTTALVETEWADYTILDLRHNPGGRLDQCITIAEQLVADSTPIITFRQRYYDDVSEKAVEIEENFVAEGPGTYAERELLVLVDGYSASASEILVSCLMQREKVQIIGSATYGKGRGQVLIEGPDSVVAKITCMTFTPYGENQVSYDNIGIIPEIIVDSTEDAFDVALDQIEERSLAKHLICRTGKRPGVTDVPLYKGEPATWVEFGAEK